MRRATAALLAGLLALLSVPAASASKPKVVVTGQVRYADGTPAARVHVELTRVTGLGDVLGGLLFFTFSAGFASVLCFDEEGRDALVICGNNTAATLTDSKGNYRFEMSADAVDSPDRSFTVTARVPRSAKRAAGAQVEVRTHLKVGANRLPYLPFWEPTVSGPLSDLTWTPLPGEAHPSYDKHYASRSGGLTLDVGALPGDPLDPRLLEDTRGTFHLTAKGHRGSLGATWTSPTRPYTGTAGRPLSRSARCTVTVEKLTGNRALRPCWLTDARYRATYEGPRPRHCFVDPAFADPVFQQPPTCEFASVRVAEIDLGRVVPVAAVLVRGECDDCAVAGSEDHVTWTRPTDGLVPGTAQDWEGLRARWVRVLTPSTSLGRYQYETPGAKVGGKDLPDSAPGDASRLTELSVWAATPEPVAAGSAPPEPDSSASPTTAAPSTSDDGTRTPTLVAAALLLLVTAGAVGYAVGQRRRTGG
jgi:hypothetical protein